MAYDYNFTSVKHQPETREMINIEIVCKTHRNRWDDSESVKRKKGK